MQIETKVSHRFTPIKTHEIAEVGTDVEFGQLCTVDGNVKKKPM